MSASSWDRFQQHFLEYPQIGLSIDISRMRFADDFLAQMEPAAQKAFAAMRELEAGAIANPDEERMVGHYWLRDSRLAPNEQLRTDVEQTKRRIQEFAAKVHSGKIAGASGDALPQPPPDRHRRLCAGPAVCGRRARRSRGQTGDPLLRQHRSRWLRSCPRSPRRRARRDARRGDLEVGRHRRRRATGCSRRRRALQAAGVSFAKHAVAVTGVGSELDRHAEKNGWLARFPMFDWIGGRTSVMSAVGLLPAALQGVDLDAFSAARRRWMRRRASRTLPGNAAMLLALMWHYAGNGRGEKDMVILPYKDRLMLFSRYLQQLVMESLGKEKDLDGKLVHQGIAVYGNKGSTDQHAYVQQLRDGVLNFFVTFIEVRKDRAEQRFEVEDGLTSGDYLHGFLRGTRAALYENGRESITISISDGECIHGGRFDCALRACGRVLRLAGEHQRLPPAGRGSRQEGGDRPCWRCSNACVPGCPRLRAARRSRSRSR
jgi:glucose-6-phosphate isomerase